MLAKLAAELPPEGGVLYEPKWDGFRALVFKNGRSLFLQSRDARPLDRYFPDLHDKLLERVPKNCVLDGEIVIATRHGLDFDALQMRLHPAASRVAKLAAAQPASFVAFDVLAVGSKSLMARPQAERREKLEALLASAEPPLYLTPMTRDRSLALDWLDRFEGAGLDGVVAKPADALYQPGKRVMLKVKHVRTADCVVAGFRFYKSGADAVGSLLLGLYDDGVLQHIGVAASFPMTRRAELVEELAPYRAEALDGHPWQDWANAQVQENGENRMPGAISRWNAKKDLSWVPLRPELVVEIRYDQLEGRRLRHTGQFLRWRPDRDPLSCTYDQLEVPVRYDLAEVLAGGGSPDRE
jgi:ATP-dependent DNA ligase